MRNYIDTRRLQNLLPGRPSLSKLGVLEIPPRVPENPRIAWSGSKGEPLVKPAILAVAIFALAACSSSTPPPPSDPTASAAILKKDCSDPKWQEENLGLWYS